MAIIIEFWFVYQLNLNNFLKFLDLDKFDFKLLSNTNNITIVNLNSN